jgi:hypothetical protein
MLPKTTTTISWIPWRKSDLRSYLRNAQLPEMIFGLNIPDGPREGHKSHINRLAVRLEHYRQLESVRRITNDHFVENINKSRSISLRNLVVFDVFLLLVLDTYVPRDSLTLDDVHNYEVNGERLACPSTNFKMNIPDYALNRPENIIQ